MILTYTKDYRIKIWKNGKIIDIIFLKDRAAVDQWRKDNPDIKMEYFDKSKTKTYTLEQ